MILSFGNHQGKDLADVPSSYLRWLAENHSDEDLVEEVEKELNYRDDHSGHFED